MDATTDIDVEVAPQSEKEKKMDKIFSPVVVMGGSWGSRSGTILPSATSSAPWVMLSTPLSLAAWAARTRGKLPLKPPTTSSSVSPLLTLGHAPSVSLTAPIPFKATSLTALRALTMLNGMGSSHGAVGFVNK